MVKIQINEKVKKLKEKSKSKNTQEKYEGDWQKFINYCQKMYSCNPLDVDDLNSAYAVTANYLDWLYESNDAIKQKGKSRLIKSKRRANINNNPYSNTKYKASTIQRILASITFKYRSNNFQFDRKNPDISDTISAIIRSDKNSNLNQAKELLKKDIEAIIDSISTNDEYNVSDIRDKALILVGFYSFCRRSELLSMKYEHLRFSKDSIEVLIPHSKTDQIGLGRPISLPKKLNNYCPVKSLLEWLKISGIKSGPLFYKINKSKRIETKTIGKYNNYVSLSDANFVLILKKRAKSAGLKDYEKISGHSLRRGAITQARINGVPIHEIMAQSGHKTTQMIDRYTKISDIKKYSASKKI